MATKIKTSFICFFYSFLDPTAYLIRRTHNTVKIVKCTETNTLKHTQQSIAPETDNTNPLWMVKCHRAGICDVYKTMEGQKSDTWRVREWRCYWRDIEVTDMGAMGACQWETRATTVSTTTDGLREKGRETKMARAWNGATQNFTKHSECCKKKRSRRSYLTLAVQFLKRAKGKKSWKKMIFLYFKHPEFPLFKVIF